MVVVRVCSHASLLNKITVNARNYGKSKYFYYEGQKISLKEPTRLSFDASTELQVLVGHHHASVIAELRPHCPHYR